MRSPPEPLREEDGAATEIRDEFFETRERIAPGSRTLPALMRSTALPGRRPDGWKDTMTVEKMEEEGGLYINSHVL